MTRKFVIFFLTIVFALIVSASNSKIAAQTGASQTLRSPQSKTTAGHNPPALDGMFYETAHGRVPLPFTLTAALITRGRLENTVKMPDGRVVKISLARDGLNNFLVKLTAQPNSDITKWGLAVDSQKDEYYTGLMERVIDGPQQASWAPGLKEAMDLRGQKVDMIVKPTTSIYAPFYISSRGYGVFVKGTWPGFFDFAAADPDKVKIEFEGPTFELKVYTAASPAALVRAHAMDAGPPFLPPKWAYGPWRWRDEHTQRDKYYDGTPVTGPFNSEAMEDIMMMKAFGIPNSVYWIDRPWGPGAQWGYDDFKIDYKRLPNFEDMVKWLSENDTHTLMWIAAFYQGDMEKEALAKGYTLAGQQRPPNGNNYPMVDLTNPKAKAYWQSGIEKLLKMGVAAFKLDRGEEDMPDSGSYELFDGRSIRENRNAYVAMYVKAVYDIAKKYRGNDFLAMPRGAYTGSSAYGVFWGGDIGGVQEGLRESIIAVQRAAVMGYPNWGSDTCGYTRSLMEQEVCGRWLAFSAFTPIMEVGPTRNVGFWNLPREPAYDAELIAIWRLYARLHDRLKDYTYRQATVAHQTGMPIVRPLFLMDPKSKESWSNWQTYLYGPDILVSPVWEKNKRSQEVYLPAGHQWRDAWKPKKIYKGGQTITVSAELHQLPIFIRVGSTVTLGNLNDEYKESKAISEKRPDLKKLDAELREWEARRQKTAGKGTK
jgi:alpha-glucosidase (family GH31 glycosyl hydrolase)